MDEDRVDTHIITTEAPRDHSEARTLLGRVVGDTEVLHRELQHFRVSQGQSSTTGARGTDKAHVLL